MSEVQNIRVAVRCRPLSKKELGNKEKSIFSIKSGNVELRNPSDDKVSTFNFDRIWPDDSKQTEVWDFLGQPMLDKCMEGFNGTVFAYGQTGSGKTFSMQGVQTDPELKGLIPRFTYRLFDRIVEEKEKDKNKLFLVTCSYFEIYNEVISDLLDPSSKKKGSASGLDVKEHPVLGVYVKGLQEIVVEGAPKMNDLIMQGMGNRHVAATAMNEESSRSHSVFTIKIHQKDATDESKSMFSKVNLVDLAGSERAKSTGASGATLKEGANINKSLSALGNVINALVEQAKGKKKGVFIPYRNSKLTRVLQESLGGNSLTSMLAALSPAAINYDETLSTLNYAARAKSIKLSAKKNEEASQVSKLNDEIAALKKALAEMADGQGPGVPAAASGGGGGEVQLVSDPEAEEKFKAQIRELEAAMNDTWEEKQKLSAEKEAERKDMINEQREALLRAQEEREKRWQLIEEKDDVELSVRNVCDSVAELPTNDWLSKVRSMLSLEQEIREETTVTSVYFDALKTDNALLTYGNQLTTIDEDDNQNPSVTSFGLRQLTSKVSHLQTTSKKLLKTQGELVEFCTSFVREIRASCEKWENEIDAAEAAGEEKEGEDETEDEKLKRKAEKDRKNQQMEDAARGLRMVVRQLNKKRIEINSGIAKEREKLFAVMEHSRTVMEVVQNEITKAESRSVEDKVFSQEEIDEQRNVLQNARGKIKAFFDEQQANAALAEEEKKLEGAESKMEESMDVSDSDMKEARSLGVGSGKILNKQMTASHNAETACSARLNCKTKAGGWVGVERCDTEQYLQIDLKRQAIVTGVATQGLFIEKETDASSAMATLSRKKYRKEIRKVKKQSTKQVPVTRTEMVAPITIGDVNARGINDDLTQTRDILATVINWPTLLKNTPPEKLLGRPPVRFLFDLINLVSRTTKFGADQPWSSTNWKSLQSKGDKVSFMDSVIGHVVEQCGGAQAGIEPPALGSDIVTGSEAGNTNRFLQLMGIAATAFSRGLKGEAVVLGGETTITDMVEEVFEEEVEEEVDVEIVEDVPPLNLADEKKDDGSEEYGSFVKKFKILYSSENDDNEDGFQLAGEFVGADAVTNHALVPPIPSARFIRLVPVEWTGGKPCMRVDVIGLYRDERENATVLISPRLNEVNQLAGLSLTGNEFADKLNDLLGNMHLCVTALLSNSEKVEGGEKIAAQKKREDMMGAMTNLAEEKEELNKQLERANQQLREQETYIAELLAKANESQFSLIKLQAEKEKDSEQIRNLQKVSVAWEDNKKEMEEKMSAIEAVAAENARAKEEASEALSVLTDERDLARNNEEQLFLKVAETTSELEALQESYVYMTERCNNYQDDIMELQEQAEGYQSVIKQMAVNQPVVLSSGKGSSSAEVPTPAAAPGPDQSPVRAPAPDQSPVRAPAPVPAPASAVSDAPSSPQTDLKVTPSTSLDALSNRDSGDDSDNDGSPQPREKTESEIEAEELAEMYGGNTESVAVVSASEAAVKKKKKTKRELEEEALLEMYGEEDLGSDASAVVTKAEDVDVTTNNHFDGTGELRGQLPPQFGDNQREAREERLVLPTLGGAGEKIFADPDSKNNSFAVNKDAEEDYFVDYGDGSYGEDFDLEDDFEIDRPSDFDKKKKARPSSANRTRQRGGEGGGFTGL